ncbi:MAG TPA: hypothetical protein VG099_09325 [Gemmataceae bacterium]|nr:hypothetical protein [Gemmataceae bacterium]
MPIRFRCAYCNQLLGIARRKAGTVVRCPTCAGQVVVPTVETNEPEGRPGEEKQLIFERSDFDELLSPEGAGPAPAGKKPALLTSGEEPIAIASAAAAPAKTWAAPSQPSVPVEHVLTAPIPAPAKTAPPEGVFISRTRATLLMVAAIVAIALAFGGGVLAGYFLRQPPDSGNPSSASPAAH